MYKTGFFIAFIILLLLPLSASGVPPYLSNQGMIYDSDNTPITGVEQVVFTLYNSAENGQSLWSETLDLAFDAGYYSAILGMSENLELTIFDGQTLYLGIALGDNAELVPRKRVSSVPYAIRANTANSVQLEDGTDIIDESGNWVGSEITTVADSALNTYLSTNNYMATEESDGTENYLVKFGSTVLVDSGLFETEGKLGVGTDDPQADLHVEGNTILHGEDRYLNFGTVVGEDGYGFRDVGGTIQFKNDGENWDNFGNNFADEFGSGNDGDLAVSSEFNINTMTSGERSDADGIAYQVSSLDAGSIETAAAVSGIAEGDKILLILIQANGTDADIGKYQMLDVTGVGEQTISVPSGSIDTSNFDEGSDQKILVQRIPQYTNVTISDGGKITACAWDGFSSSDASPSGNRCSGIVAFSSLGNTVVGGDGIDVSMKGFQGGVSGSNGAEDARNSNITNDGANGGVGATHANGGAGGGSGNAGAGGNSTYSGGSGGRGGGGGSSSGDQNGAGNEGSGGGGAAPYSSGDNFSTDLLLGLGGGSASGAGGGAGGMGANYSPNWNPAQANGGKGSHNSNNWSHGGNGSSGNNGGGMVFIYTKSLEGGANITSNGGNGGSGGGGGGGTGYDGSAGGGGGGGADGAAGGTIFVRYETESFGGTMVADGGDGGGGGGGGAGDGGGSGGGGGGGVGGGGGGGGSRTSGQTNMVDGSGKGGDGGEAGNNGSSSHAWGSGGSASGGGGSASGTHEAAGANTGGGCGSCGVTNPGLDGESTVNGGGGGRGGHSGTSWGGGGGGAQAGAAGNDGYISSEAYVSADLAEWMPSSDVSDLSPGDLLSYDLGNEKSLVRKSKGMPYAPHLMGVISTYPAVEMGAPYNKEQDVPVALAGRVPLKVTTDNGVIVPGDPITSSKIPGVAMKATRGGNIIGFAMTPYDRDEVGLITVFIKPQWHSGSRDGVELTDGVVAPHFYNTIPKPDKPRDPVISSPIELLNQIHGNQFQLSSKPGHYIYGFMPESVELATPDAVLRDDNGIRGIDYSQIIPILVESNKEQQRKLEMLEQKILDFEKKNSQ